MSTGRWQLTPESLEALLQALGPDREAAAREYGRLRHRLTKLFRWRGSIEPDGLVDETLDRVAGKLNEGVEIEADDPFRYVAAVAHRVFHEVLRKELRERRALEQSRYEPEPDPVTDEDRHRLRCLDECLEKLGDPSEWILRFYEGEKGIRIRNRKQLATELGITTNALRIRAHRLRAQLEDCVRECAERDPGTDVESDGGSEDETE